MDTTKKNIEMLKKAEEIQKEWIPHTGDWFLDKSTLPLEIEVFGGWYVLREKGFIERVGDSDNYDFEAKGKVEVWLPTQAQLQNILNHPKQWADSPFDMLCSIYDFSQDWCGGGAETIGLDKFGEYLKKFSSAEQIWLAFVMKQKYHKVWNDKEKEWKEVS